MLVYLRISAGELHFKSTIKRLLYSQSVILALWRFPIATGFVELVVKRSFAKKNLRFSASKKLRSKNPDDTCVTLVLSQLLSNIYLVMIIKYLLDKKLEFLKYPQIFLRWSIRQIRLYLRTDRQTVKICTRCHFREFIDYPAIHCCWSCAFHTKKTDLCEEKCNPNSLSRRHISGKHNSKCYMGK